MEIKHFRMIYVKNYFFINELIMIKILTDF